MHDLHIGKGRSTNTFTIRFNIQHALLMITIILYFRVLEIKCLKLEQKKWKIQLIPRSVFKFKIKCLKISFQLEYKKIKWVANNNGKWKLLLYNNYLETNAWNPEFVIIEYILNKVIIIYRRLNALIFIHIVRNWNFLKISTQSISDRIPLKQQLLRRIHLTQ